MNKQQVRSFGTGGRRLAAVAVAALCLITSTAAAGAQAHPPTMPDTPAGKRAAALLATIELADESSVRAFVREHMGGNLQKMPMEMHLQQFGRMRQDLTGAEVVGIEVRRPDAIELVLRPSAGDPLRLALEVEPQPPHQIVGLRVGPADAAPTVSFSSWDDLDQQLRAQAAEDRFSGTVLAKPGDSIAFHQSYGQADRAAGTPNRSDTRFNLGSIDKGFTGVTILRLAQEGRLNLGDPIGKYLKGFPEEVANRVTIRQLLQHRSGFGDYLTHPKFQENPKQFRAVGDYLALARTVPLKFEPGTRQRYSNLGYAVLGGIIEAIMGRSYYDVVRDFVFRPAGMTATNSIGRAPGQENTAVGYIRQGDASGFLVANDAMRAPRGSPAGGGYSTAEDLARFVDALVHDRLLDRQHTDLFLNTYRPVDAPRERSGNLGLAGGAPGINGAWEVNLGTGDVVVVLSNFDPPVAQELAPAIMRQMSRSGERQ